MKRKLIFLLPIFLLFFPVKVLNIQSDRSCKVLLGRAEVEVEYIHSVSHTKVLDVYIVNGSGIYAWKQLWQQFDAGQPISYDEVKDGFFVKKLENVMGKSLDYGFIQMNCARVKVNGKVVFSNLTKLHLEVEEIPFIVFAANRCDFGG